MGLMACRASIEGCAGLKMLILVTELTACSHIFNKQWHTCLRRLLLHSVVR